VIVAITGANGFIGSHLAEAYLRQGHQVRALMRAGRSLPRDVALSPGLGEVPVDYGDARDLRRALAGADLVIHAAGATRAPPPARLGLTQANVGISRRVARAVAREPARLVFISSQAAAGPATVAGRPVRESDQPAPVEAYGASKLEAERAIAEELERDRWTFIRPAAVYGPRERDFVALFRAARSGCALHPGNRGQSIGIVHVDDLVRGIVAAAAAPAAAGRTYFLANADPVTWGELFEAAADACGSRIRLDLQLPRSLVDAMGWCGDLHARLTGHAGLLTSQKLALSKPRLWHCSTEAAARDLGFAPEITLPDGLRRTYAWYRAASWL
jgi:nucleoside-diphosphate-sugar epimerase